MILPSLDRLSRDIHRKLGQYIARRDAVAGRRSHDELTQRIKQTYSKINIGCGKDGKLAGCLNVDVDPSCLPDLVIVDGDDSMIPRQHFRKAFARDVLEHIPRHKTLAALLGWSDYLVDGGKLSLQTSSILDVAKKLQQRTRYEDQHGWTICLFGNQAHPADFHHTGFTDVTLRVHLLAAGFSVDAIGLEGEWLLTADATKIENWAALSEADIGSDADFVREAFRQALFRDIERGDLEFWIDKLKGGLARKEVLRAFYDCPERLFRTAERHHL